jgi:ribosomal protein L37AE/L43A
MDEEKRKKFLEEVERLKEERKNRPKEEPKYPYELFGVECGEGWKKLYQPIIDYVTKYNETNEDKIDIHQIKEKFGALRIYLSKYNEEVRQMIDDAEEISYYTCEDCGKYIKKPIVVNHWIYPLCNDCYRKWEEDRAKAMEEATKKIREKKASKSENS